MLELYYNVTVSCGLLNVTKLPESYHVILPLISVT